MLKIRLKRVGRKHDPSFRIVVTEKHLGPKSGKYIENVGFYNVLKGDKTINGERVKYWMSKGAQVSNTVHNLLISEGIIEGKKKNVLPKKSPIQKGEGGEEKGVEESQNPKGENSNTNDAPVEEATPEEDKKEEEEEIENSKDKTQKNDENDSKENLETTEDGQGEAPSEEKKEVK